MATARCGQLFCQRDSYARSLSTHVVSCRPSTAKEDKGNEVWEVVLDDSVMFPEGGGQPYDVGRANGVPVRRVINIGGDAVHFVEAQLDVGQKVTVDVDWTRRWDLMQQHSGQHLITALALQMGYETKSWCLGADVSTLDLGAELTREELETLDTQVNRAIFEGHAIGPRWISPDGDEAKSIRCRGLPDSVTGPLRVLEIEGIDTNLCCGTHVNNTSHLQQVKILRSERLRDRGVTLSRLHFVVGGRVSKLLGDIFQRQLHVTSALNVGVDELPKRVESLLKNEKESSREIKSLHAELVALTARNLQEEVQHGAKALQIHRDRGTVILMRDFATALEACGVLVLITIGEKDEGMFMLSGPEAMVAELGPAVAQKLEGRGGGKGRYQGKVSKLSAREEAFELILAAANDDDHGAAP